MGKFKCEDCNNEWHSAHAWKNTWQQCVQCKTKGITWNLWKKRFNGKQGDKAHRSGLCQRCLSGRKCVKST